MIRLQDKTNAVAPDSDYPYGNVKDRDTTPGTLANTQMFGDAMQFFEKMIAESGITPNGLPDNEYSGWQLWEAFLLGVQNSLKIKGSLTKDSGDEDKVQLDGDEETPILLSWYGTNESGTRGWQRPITGSVEVDGTYFRFDNWTDYSFVFSAGSSNKTINYSLIGNVLFLNFALSVDFVTTGTDPSDFGDIFIKIPPVLGDYTVREDENFTVRIGDDTPFTSPDFTVLDTLIDTQTVHGCGLNEVHLRASLIGSGTNTLILRGQMHIILDV